MDRLLLPTLEELDTLIQSSVRKALSEQNNQNGKASIELFTIDQACEYLNLAKQTLYTFTSKRLIPFLKRGRKLYFKKSELEAWLNEGKKPTIKEIQNEPLYTPKTK